LVSATNTLQSEKTESQIQTEKQKAAISDVIAISEALVDFITDLNEFPHQEGSYDENSEIYKALYPYYIEDLPMEDPWGNNYLIYCGTLGNGQYGISKCEEDDFVVGCLGMDGKKESWKFNFSDPEAGIFKVNVLDDFNNDLVCWNGSWIRAPEIAMDSK